MYFIIEVIDVQESKMHLINKIFNNETIRTVWDKDNEKYYISVVDVVGIIAKSDNPRKYWQKVSERLKKEGNETATICRQLKLKVSDGKYRLTDATDIEGMFKIKGNMELAKMGGSAAKVARENIEKNLGEKIISKSNNLDSKYLNIK